MLYSAETLFSNKVSIAFPPLHLWVRPTDTLNCPLSGDTGCTKKVLVLPSDGYTLSHEADINCLVTAM